MYSDSSSAAMTMPMITSSAGSTIVTNRAEVRVDLLVVEVRQAVEHLLQRAGRLADFDHLDRDVRKRAAARSIAAASARPSRTCCAAVCSSRAMYWLPIERAETSIAFTSGMPPPSSVASVRAACEVENFCAIGAEHRNAQDPPVEARAGCPAASASARTRPPPPTMPEHHEQEVRAPRSSRTPTMNRVESGSSLPNCS